MKKEVKLGKQKIKAFVAVLAIIGVLLIISLVALYINSSKKVLFGGDSEEFCLDICAYTQKECIEKCIPCERDCRTFAYYNKVNINIEECAMLCIETGCFTKQQYDACTVADACIETKCAIDPFTGMSNCVNELKNCGLGACLRQIHPYKDTKREYRCKQGICLPETTQCYEQPDDNCTVNVCVDANTNLNLPVSCENIRCAYSNEVRIEELTGRSFEEVCLPGLLRTPIPSPSVPREYRLRYERYRGTFESNSFYYIPEMNYYEFRALLTAIAQKESSMGVGSLGDCCLMGYNKNCPRDPRIYDGGYERQISLAANTLASALNRQSPYYNQYCANTNNFNALLECVLSVYNQGRLNAQGRAYAQEVLQYYEPWKNYFFNELLLSERCGSASGIRLTNSEQAMYDSMPGCPQLQTRERNFVDFFKEIFGGK